MYSRYISLHSGFILSFLPGVFPENVDSDTNKEDSSTLKAESESNWLLLNINHFNASF